MSELTPVLTELLRDVDAGRPVALCAVLKTRGSTPQAAGAAMLVRADYSTLGTLGGGCVEAEVKKRAYGLLQAGRAALLDFTLNHDYGWDDGLICGGKMSIGVMPVAPGADLAEMRAALAAAARREPAAFPMQIEHEGQQLEYTVKLEAPPTLLIAGAGHVGAALARLAADLDFHVVVIDDRADLCNRDRLGERAEPVVDDIERALRAHPLGPDCYVVIVTRGHQHDHQALAAVIGRPAGYIGLIGSRRKSLLIFNDLRAAGVAEDALARVHTPIGLPIGAITVPEIAVSIAAQLVETRRRNARPLVEGPRECMG